MPWGEAIAERICTLRRAFFQSCFPGEVGLGSTSFSIGDLGGSGDLEGSLIISDCRRIGEVGTSEKKLLLWAVGSLASRSSLSSEELLCAYAIPSTLQESRCRVSAHCPSRSPMTCRVRRVRCMPGSFITMVLYSISASLSHFLPRCRRKMYLSDANHAETAARPKDVNAVKTVVKVDVAAACHYVCNVRDMKCRESKER